MVEIDETAKSDTVREGHCEILNLNKMTIKTWEYLGDYTYYLITVYDAQ